MKYIGKPLRDALILDIRAVTSEGKPFRDNLVTRLERNGYMFPFQHVILEGTHEEPTRHFDKVFAFLESHFNRPLKSTTSH